MGDSRAVPGFGQIDLDLEDESGRGFGDLLDDDPASDPVPPSSTTRTQTAKPVEPSTRVTRKALEPPPDDEPPPASVHEDRTRVVPASESLSNLTRKPPPMPDDEPSASQPGGAPSGSGIATRDDRVAAMRELYAKGDATGALMLAATMEDMPAPEIRTAVDHPDASIAVEFSMEEVDEDPFGGLIPIEIDDVLNERERTVNFQIDPSSAVHTLPTPIPPPPQPIAGLSLTMRQSIPRVLKSMGEVAKLPIDHRAGFLLSHFDGMQTLEEILDVCAMPTDEALALITSLQEMGVIELE